MDGRSADMLAPPDPATVVSTGQEMKLVVGNPQALKPGIYVDARVGQVPQAVPPAARSREGTTDASIPLPDRVVIQIGDASQAVNRFGESDVGYYYDAQGKKHNVVISTSQEVDDATASQLRSQPSVRSEPVPLAAAPVEQGTQASPSERFFNEAGAIQAWVNQDLTKKARAGEHIYHYIERVFGVPQDRMAAFAGRVKAAVDAQPPAYHSKGNAERAALAAQDLLRQSFGEDVFLTARVLGYWSGRADKNRREWTIPEIAQSTNKSVSEISNVILKLKLQPGESKQQAMDRFFSTKQSLLSPS